MKLGDRLKKIRGELSREKFSQRLGVSKNTIVNYENGDRSPDAVFLLKVLDFHPDISPAWLLTGEGPMRSLSAMDSQGSEIEHKGELVVSDEDLKSIGERIDRALGERKADVDPNKFMSLLMTTYRFASRNYLENLEFRNETIDKYIHLLMSDGIFIKDGCAVESGKERAMAAQGGLDSEEYALVPRYGVKASAGHGSIVESEQIVDHMAFKRQWIRTMGLDVSHLALISAKGDSMEPTIKDGYLLLVDLRVHEVKGDAIYILRLDGELIAKRLQRIFDGGIKIKSDNQAYDEQVVPQDYVGKLNIIGRVVWGGGRM